MKSTRTARWNLRSILLISMALVLTGGTVCALENPEEKLLPIEKIQTLFITHAKLQKVLLQLGSPSCIMLAGEDEDVPTPTANDDVLLRYEKVKIILERDHECQLSIILNKKSYKVERAELLFTGSSMSIREVVSYFGKEDKILGIKTVWGETTGESYWTEERNQTSNSWMFIKIGLEVLTEIANNSETVELMVFSRQSLKGQSLFSKWKSQE